MNSSLRIFLCIAIAVYFVILVVMLKRSKLSLRYALLWIISGLGMVFFVAFPTVVFRASALIGISNPVNAIFFLFACFTMVMMLSLTSFISGMSVKNLRLTQNQALLEERVRELEQKLDDAPQQKKTEKK